MNNTDYTLLHGNADPTDAQGHNNGFQAKYTGER